MLTKLTSRKLWAAIAGFVAGLAMVFGLDETIISIVAGAVVSVASVVTYIKTEGNIDVAKLAEKIGRAGEAVQGAVDALKGEAAGSVTSATVTSDDDTV